MHGATTESGFWDGQGCRSLGLDATPLQQEAQWKC